MQMERVIRVLSSVLRGYTTVGSDIQTRDLYDAVNIAIQKVADDLNTYYYAGGPFLTPVTNGEGPDSGALLFAPEEVDSATQDFPLPDYCLMACVYYAANILAERGGEFAKTGDKDLSRLVAMFQQELMSARRAVAARSHNHPRRVEDGTDPDRFTRSSFF